MIELFLAGGPTFMLPLTLVAAAVLFAAIRGAMTVRESAKLDFWMRLLFHLGLFAFVVGILSQAVSLYQMMGVIEAVGGVSPEIMMGGLRVSLIAPFYGIGIFISAMVLRFILEGTGRALVTSG